MLSLKQNVLGVQFAQLIAICFHFADTFSLTKNGWLKADEFEESICLLEHLKQYHFQTLHTNHWFSYYVPDGHDIEVYLFKATPESKNIFLAEYNRMFYDGVLWRKPEDFCFFQKGKLILGSVSHENICYVYEQEDALGEQIKCYGEWEQIPDALEEQIQIF